MTRAPEVAAVVLNWRNGPETVACLRSVQRLRYPSLRVFVVDNGSGDDSVELIRRECAWATVIENDENLGYADGNNVGIRHAYDAGADYVLLLNNDTTVAENMLAELVNVAESNPDAGMVGPSVYDRDHPSTLFGVGSFINWRTGSTWHRTGLESGGSAQSVVIENVDFVEGCCVLVRREVIARVGVLEPLYYLNYEDVDWSVRTVRHGFRVTVAPAATLWHKGSLTLGRATPANTYYMTRNALLFFSRNAPGHLRHLAVGSILLRALRTVGAWTLRPRYWDERHRRLRLANVLAVRDFSLGRFGRMGPDVARVCQVG